MLESFIAMKQRKEREKVMRALEKENEEETLYRVCQKSTDAYNELIVILKRPRKDVAAVPG